MKTKGTLTRFALLVLVAASACEIPLTPGGQEPGSQDAGTSVVGDAGIPTPDAGEPEDAGVEPVVDAGTRDAGQPTPDAGVKDGGVRDGGPVLVDGGTGDGGWYGGPSRCGSAGALVCDGFEALTLDATTWQRVERNGGAVSLDSTRAARGTRSVKVHAGIIPGSTAFIAVGKIFPIAKNTVFARAFVYVADHSSNMHTSFIEGDGNVTNGTTGAGHVRYGGPKGNFTANYDNSICHQDSGARSTTPVPLDRWSCFEVEFNGQTFEQRFWLNGTEVTAAHHVLAPDPTKCTAAAGWTSAKLFPALEKLSFGFRLYHDEAAPFDLWYDEVAVDTKRIGCAR